jgi:hypothetical protein
MVRRSIMLLLTLAVLLQPAFASVCLMDCPPQVAAHRAQPMAGHVAHAHHHGMTTVNDRSLAIAASRMCDRTVDLRSKAVIPPTVSPAAMTSDLVVLGTASPTVLSPWSMIERADRFSPPIGVPLRI